LRGRGGEWAVAAVALVASSVAGWLLCAGGVQPCRSDQGEQLSLMGLVRSAGVWLVFVASVVGCLVDPDAPCGDQFSKVSDGACACPAGSIVVGGACAPCAEHERSEGNQCVCESGYARAAGAAECVLAGPAEPAPSSSDAEGCSSSAECAAGLLCDVYGSRECVAAPNGLGTACAMASDCAATEATFCDTFASRTCQVQGCDELGGVCPGDMVCCRYAILSTSLCIDTAHAPGGQCPAPGERVTRSDAP